MSKKFPRGKPEGPNAVAMNKIVRAEMETWAQDILNEFGLYELHDLINGEIELVAKTSGDDFRCYVIFDAAGESRLVIDDYHPNADADIPVDEFGRFLATDEGDTE